MYFRLLYAYMCVPWYVYDTDAQPLALMSPVFPSPQLQLLLLHPINARKVQFFVGTVKSSSDLRRVKAADALAVFIFADDADVAEVSCCIELCWKLLNIKYTCSHYLCVVIFRMSMPLNRTTTPLSSKRCLSSTI
jgi:hypothetical protein